MRSNYVMDAGDPDLIEATIMVKPSERQGGMRLNSVMKQQVLEKAVKHAFDKRRAALLKEEQALAKACWLHLFGPAKLKAALSLGEPFVVSGRDRYGHKTDEGMPMNYYVGGRTYCLRTQQPVPANYAFGGDTKYARVKDDALAERCAAHAEAVSDLNKEVESVTGTLNGMLAGISTYTSLEKNWPQGKPFYKHLPAAFPYRHQVPAVLVAQLNDALGIG